MSNRLPIIIQSIVYRVSPGGAEILLLKRTEERGGFWSFVNGTLEVDESAVSCRQRELFEETGITSIKKWSDELHRFSFKYKEHIFVTVVFATEVPLDTRVTINDEHTDYKWASFDEGKNLLKFDDDKLALERCQLMLNSENK